MRSFLYTALLAIATLGTVHAQTNSTEAKMPELPQPAGQEATNLNIPAPTSTYDTIPDTALSTPAPSTPSRQMSPEEVARLKQDENWLVEGMKKKQEDDAAAALKLKKASELSSKKDEIKESAVQPGDLSGFKPVLANSSLNSLNLNQPSDQNSPTGKKKSLSQTSSFMNDSTPTGSNPLKTSSNGVVQPILGPSRQAGMSQTVADLNPGVGIAPLPGTGIKKISSNTNFVPEGYADSWTKQQQQNPYKPLTPQANKPLPPAAPATPRPTFKDLANTIPDPTQVR